MYGRSSLSRWPTTHKWPLASTLNELAKDRALVNRNPLPTRLRNQPSNLPSSCETCRANGVAVSPQLVSIIGVGLAVGEEVVFIQRKVVVALVKTVELGRWTDVVFAWIVGTAVVLSHRPVVVLGANVGMELLSHIGLVVFNNSGVAVEALNHWPEVVFLKGWLVVAVAFGPREVVALIGHVVKATDEFHEGAAVLLLNGALVRILLDLIELAVLPRKAVAAAEVFHDGAIVVLLNSALKGAPPGLSEVVAFLDSVVVVSFTNPVKTADAFQEGVAVLLLPRDMGTEELAQRDLAVVITVVALTRYTTVSVATVAGASVPLKWSVATWLCNELWDVDVNFDNRVEVAREVACLREECRPGLLVRMDSWVNCEPLARLLLVDFDVTFPSRPVRLFPRELVALERSGKDAVLKTVLVVVSVFVVDLATAVVVVRERPRHEQADE
ncbi:hypothetical protein B0H67DRAFT_302772 [Lasiosphaeris hirsuta]|uniref:Uncharacterized protein n=1 Tax=Lasiosphaeris hirsuta TaxID=260670 RepID=A0AA40A9R7_9PEZI|nr:hypothetical protein B0H67DRAFT_302772 [Lasiosphaeris hirsuta]